MDLLLWYFFHVCLRPRICMGRSHVVPDILMLSEPAVLTIKSTLQNISFYRRLFLHESISIFLSICAHLSYFCYANMPNAVLQENAMFNLDLISLTSVQYAYAVFAF